MLNSRGGTFSPPVLIYTRFGWELFVVAGCVEITKDELDEAEERENGFIKKWAGVNCYLNKYIYCEDLVQNDFIRLEALKKTTKKPLTTDKEK